MKCFQCRAELPEGTRFCTHCDEEQGFSPDLIEKHKKATKRLFRNFTVVRINPFITQ